MSGALSSIFGGGNILGALMSIASVAFPPLAIANSLSNLLVSAIGEALKMAVSTLMKESGMPKFIGSAINNLADSVLPQHMKATDPAVDQFVGGNSDVQDTLKKFTQQLSDSFVENGRKAMAKEKASSSGKASTGSWLQAIAEAMGETMGQKAADMVNLSQQMADLSSQAKGLSSDDTAGQAQNAKDFSIVQAKFQATSQEYSILSNTFANAIKAIGEGLSAMGRKG